MRWTAPMKASCPPPTMPRRRRRRARLRMCRRLPWLQPSSPSMRRLAASSVPPPAKSSKAFSVTRMIWARDEVRPFARAVLGVLQAAFPFHHRPAVKVVLRQLREDAAEIDLAVAERAEAPGAVDPGLEAAIDALPAGRVQLRVLDVEHADPVVVDVDVGQDSRGAAARSARVVEHVARACPFTRSRNISKVTPSCRSSPGWIS